MHEKHTSACCLFTAFCMINCHENDLCRALRYLGATIDGPTKQEFNELKVDVWPRVSWSPSFALTFNDLKVKFLGCQRGAHTRLLKQ